MVTTGDGAERVYGHVMLEHLGRECTGLLWGKFVLVSWLARMAKEAVQRAQALGWVLNVHVMTAKL